MISAPLSIGEQIMINSNEQSSLTPMISIVQNGNASQCNASFGFYFRETPSTEKLLEKIKQTRKSMQTVLGNLDLLEQEALQQQAMEHQDALIAMLQHLPEEERKKLLNI